MKQYVDNAFGGLAIGAANLNKGWNKIKNKKILTIPFINIVLPIMISNLIESKTLFTIDQFCWYSFHANYKFSNDFHLYDKDKYDIFPSDMSRHNSQVEVIYEIGQSFFGPFCSWNANLYVGFLEIDENYGYFIKYK